MEKEWYVVNTYSGHENKVKEKLEMRASSMGLEDNIYRIIVPEQKVIDANGKEKIKKLFPGYILVEMTMTDEAWFIVRNTPGVTGFIGSYGKGSKPTPVTLEEVDRLLGSMGISRLDITSEVEIGETVKVVDGPFTNMLGKVKKINVETNTLEVALDLFGQETIVELELSQITKA